MARASKTSSSEKEALKLRLRGTPPCPARPPLVPLPLDAVDVDHGGDSTELEEWPAREAVGDI